MRCGYGWKRCDGPPGELSPVFDHPSGLRIHLAGLARLPDGEYVNGMVWPETVELDRHIRIHGGNRRRGTMAWALEKLAGHRGGRTVG